MALKLVNNMEEVNQAIAASSSAIFSWSKIFFWLKKYFLLAVPQFAILAACAIVMAMTKPKSNREFLSAITATFVGAIYGPSLVILLFHIDLSNISAMDQDKVRSLFTVVCGLPGWVIIRACFNWSELNKTKTIIDLIKQFKDVLK